MLPERCTYDCGISLNVVYSTTLAFSSFKKNDKLFTPCDSLVGVSHSACMMTLHTLQIHILLSLLLLTQTIKSGHFLARILYRKHQLQQYIKELLPRA